MDSPGNATAPSYTWGKVFNLIGIGVGVLFVVLGAGALLVPLAEEAFPGVIELDLSPYQYWGMVLLLFGFGLFEIKVSYDSYHRRPYTWKLLMVLFAVFAVYSVGGFFLEGGWRRWGHVLDMALCVVNFMYFKKRRMLFQGSGVRLQGSGNREV